ncbi:hypothetical protein BGX21_003972 [Mortierella sp. AD011]|nr:hypothetical protein BGX20_004352 [Mortierella sp. AD010]KAF9374972.1 hypothetical protein BGX21_003972 [Mortierella sp. AD011]
MDCLCFITQGKISFVENSQSSANNSFDNSYHLPNLVKLTLYHEQGMPLQLNHELEGSRSDMVALNPHIRKFSWRGPNDFKDSTPIFTDSLLGLSRLTHLELGDWNAGGALGSILSALASTLIDLTLRCIAGVESSDFESVCLPSLTTMNICPDTMPGHGVWEVVCHCPNLKFLRLTLDGDVMMGCTDSPSQIVNWARMNIPNSLTSFRCDYFLNDSIILLVLLTLRSLTSLRCASPLSMAYVDNIVRNHGSTLKELHLHVESFESQEVRYLADPAAFATLMESLPLLETLHIEIQNVAFSDIHLMGTIFRQLWICLSLKEFHLDFIKITLPQQDELFDSPSSSFMIPFSSYVGFGWYVPQETPVKDRHAIKQRNEFTKRLFEHVQGMSQLKSVCLNTAQYIRTSTRKLRYNETF